jgi:hypothetical protein
LGEELYAYLEYIETLMARMPAKLLEAVKP